MTDQLWFMTRIREEEDWPVGLRGLTFSVYYHNVLCQVRLAVIHGESEFRIITELVTQLGMLHQSVVLPSATRKISCKMIHGLDG